MGLIIEILEELSKSSLKYKGVSTNLLGIPKFKNYSKGTLRGTFSYINKAGFIEDKNGLWNVTTKGKNYMRRKYDSLQQFQCKFNNNAPKNLLVMFDVPETKKAEREWLRWHLKKFDYIMVQKSVWVGPSPLPKDFMAYLSKIGLKQNLQTFKLAKGFDQKRVKLR